MKDTPTILTHAPISTQGQGREAKSLGAAASIPAFT
jgi:hypothetical protein